MSKFLILAVALVGLNARAATQWELNCNADKSVAKVPAQVLKYKVRKQAVLNPKPTPGHKWDTKYYVVVFFKAQPSKAYTYKLVPAGSGDEDYNEYKIAGTDQQSNRINVQGAYIQNQFQWVSLIDNDGYGFADCR